MPTYEYKCLECGKRFECFQSMSDPAVTNCEHCSGQVKKLIGAGAGIIFRGSGFYCTDYGKDNNGNNGNSGGKASSDTTQKGNAQQSNQTGGSQESAKSANSGSESKATSNTES
mgnify:CR=1 FL=1